jgi:alanine racemase
MAQVVRLQGKILQVRQIDTPSPVGYGATHRAGTGRRLATVGVGYADGYPRAASNRAMGRLGGWLVPLVGRVSMDLLTFDVTDAPEAEAHPGAWIELIGPGLGVDDLAEASDTIGYEVLTRLGRRYPRTHLIPPGEDLAP